MTKVALLEMLGPMTTKRGGKYLIPPLSSNLGASENSISYELRPTGSRTTSGTW